jgi:hypothetical protein
VLLGLGLTAAKGALREPATLSASLEESVKDHSLY